MKKLLTAIAIILLWAGFAWGAGVHYSGLTSTNNRCSFTSSYAWLDWSGKDFSAYAGGRWEVRLTDSSGYQAVGYVGSVGTGETLGGELVTNGTFDSDISGWFNSDISPFDTFNWSSGQLHAVDDGVAAALFWSSDDISVVAYQIYKFGYDYTVTKNAKYAGLRISQGSGGFSPFLLTPSSGSGTLEQYIVSTSTENRAFVMWMDNGAASDILLDNVSVKRVLTPSAAGVYILNGPTGSAGWASIHSSFDYNAITDIQITPAASLSGVSVSGVGINN